MTYLDDLQKMKQETDGHSGDPNASAPIYDLEEDMARTPSRHSAEQDEGNKKRGFFSKNGRKNGKNSSSNLYIEDSFTPEERQLPYLKRITLPFIQRSSIAALCFILVALLWVAISDTVFASIYGISRSTILMLMLKDAIYVVVSAGIMYQVLRKQFSHYYHLEQDYEESLANVKKWQSIQHSMLETIPDTLAFTLDCDLRYTSFNNRHKYSMLRMWHQEIRLGELFLDFIPEEEQREQIHSRLQRVLSGEYISEIEQFGDNDLTASYWKTYYAPILDDERQIVGISCFITNITSLKQSQSKNLFLSYHDPLTRLGNRLYAEELFQQAEEEEIVPYSIISIEISGMRRVNDNYGTETGDRLLIKVSEVLSRCIKENGSVIRWASDEFIVLLPNVDATTAEALMNICSCEFSGVTVNGVPLHGFFGFATRTSTKTSMKILLQNAEVRATNVNM
ncbi:MAG: diguanylate cyclase [Clostridiales bacterium]|nr:diguanylate cyclase [Candidatus Scatonaster coprocaballi]